MAGSDEGKFYPLFLKYFRGSLVERSELAEICRTKSPDEEFLRLEVLEIRACCEMFLRHLES